MFRSEDVELQNLCERLSLEETDSTSVHRFDHLTFLSVEPCVFSLIHVDMPTDAIYHDVSFAQTTIFLRFMGTFHLSFLEEPIYHQAF